MEDIETAKTNRNAPSGAARMAGAFSRRQVLSVGLKGAAIGMAGLAAGGLTPARAQNIVGPRTLRGLSVTPRSSLVPTIGVNVHFAKPSYKHTSAITSLLVGSGALNPGLVRDSGQYPGNTAQNTAFTTTTGAGTQLYLYIGTAAFGLNQSDITGIINAWDAKGYVNSIMAFEGPNEANSNESNSSWPTQATNQVGYVKVACAASSHLQSVLLAGPALKHNVDNYDTDLGLLHTAGYNWEASHVPPWNRGAFHYYPGAHGPKGDSAMTGNVYECSRANAAYDSLSRWHSETGWPTHSYSETDAGKWSVESVLRNYLNPQIAGTLLYEFLDEYDADNADEKSFGLFTVDSDGNPQSAKVGYNLLKSLCNPVGAEQTIDCSINTTADCDVVCTSQGSGNFTLYLLSETTTSCTLTIPTAGSCDKGTRGLSPLSGYVTYTGVPTTDTLTIVQLTGCAA